MDKAIEKHEDHSEDFLAIVGTKDESVVNAIYQLYGKAIGLTEKPEDTKYSLAFIDAMKNFAPADLVEGCLFSRFWALHNRGMSLLGSGEINANLAIKMLRLSSETLDTALKWRRRGEQRVVVSHLNVSDGAVVGNIVAGGIGVKMMSSSSLHQNCEDI